MEKIIIMKRIFFPDEMIIAIMEGRKTVTRQDIERTFVVGEKMCIPEKHYFEGEKIIYCTGLKNKIKSNPPQRMSAKNTRITLEVISIRDEHLHHITRDSAEKEGMKKIGDKWENYIFKGSENLYVNPIYSFRSWWQEYVGVFSWHKNPMVRVVEFKVCGK